MFKKIHVKLDERVVVFRNGLPIRALGPGRHIVWGTRLTEQRWTTDTLVFRALPEVRAVLDAEWFREVTLTSHQRGVLYRDGQPRVFLRPGVHWFWTVDPSVELHILSVDEPMPELTDTTGLVGARGHRDHQRPRARAEKVPSGSDRATITTSA